MKRIIVLLILSFSITTYCQDIEKMDKKELRIALKNSTVSKDSLISINSNKDRELTLLNQKLISSKDSLKSQKAKITYLLQFNNESEKKLKLLTEKNTFLKDSITKIKTTETFNISSFTLKTLPKNCCMVYSETKELYKTKKYICYWGENEGDSSLIFFLNDKKIILDRYFSDDETDDYQYKNDKYLVKIRKRKNIKENDIILIIESAELFIKNLVTGQEITKQLYGEGGC